MSRKVPDTLDSEQLLSALHHRPLDSDLFYMPDSVDDPMPSPPYRRVPSSSHLLMESYVEEQSPAYRSRSNIDLHDMARSRRSLEKEPELRSKTKTVHYPDDVHSPPIVPTPRAATFPRFDSTDTFISSSRPSSLACTDDEDDDEDYDWSGEDDLVDEEARFEQAMGVKKKPKFGFFRLITLLFSTLIGSTILSGLIITPALLVHFFWFKPHPTDHRRYVTDNVEAWLFWVAANISISWGLGLVVDILPAIVRILISLSWGHVSESVKSKIELYNNIKDNIKPMLYAASCWASWVILFAHIFKLYDLNDTNNSRAPYTSRIYEIIEFFFFFVLVVCAQRMLSHFIAFAFHRTAYRERIASVSGTLTVIEKLRTFRRKNRHTPKSSMAFGRSTPTLSAFGLTSGVEKDRFNFARSRPGTPEPERNDASGIEADVEDDPDATLVMKKHKGKQRSWVVNLNDTADAEPTPCADLRPPLHVQPEHCYPPSPLAQNPENSSTARKTRHGSVSDDDAAAVVQQAAAQAAKALKTAVLHDARNIRGHADDDLGGLVWDVTSSHEAKRLARSIYYTFKEGGRTYLIPSDFYSAFPTHEEAEAAFRVFDADNNGDISRAEIKTTLMKVYKERRFLSRSMRDVSLALTTLDQMLLFFAFVILFFISLSVFGVNITSSLTSVYTIGVGASFIFKNSASNAFDAIMFLFVTHPFDTGDRCFIDDENFVVKKMGLFATIFTRSDGTETYYFNSQLFTKFITNVRRSGKTAENLTMQVAWRTPLEKLDALQNCLNDWLAVEENRWFEPTTSVTLQKIDYQRHLEITIGIGHNGNWQDWGLRNARKTAFHAAVNYYCRQLGIVAYQSPLPITYVDQEMMEVPAPTPVDEEMEPSMEPEQGRPVTLGFRPPADKLSRNVRVRKARSKKAMLRTMGADGGDG